MRKQKPFNLAIETFLLTDLGKEATAIYAGGMQYRDLLNLRRAIHEQTGGALDEDEVFFYWYHNIQNLKE